VTDLDQDIVAVIGARVALKRRGNQHIGLCPFHPDKHPSLFVAPEKQAWFCFGCKAGGDVQEFERLYADRIPP
jgi:DNA primase